METDAQIFGYSDVYARYDGGTYSTALLKSVSDKLITTLFYIELIQAPAFYTSPERCRATVYCRIPPGHALLDLLYRLQHLDTHILYRGDELQYTEVPFLEPAILRKCRAGEPFRKTIEVQAYSMRTLLDVRLSARNGLNNSISHCPYELQELVRDQGLDCVFGFPDHRPYKHVSRPARNKLQKELDRIFLEMEVVLQNVQEESTPTV